MKIPDTILVGGHKYKIFKDYKYKERSDLCGQSDHELRTITMKYHDSSGNKYPSSTIEELFFHEVLHCIDYVYNSASLSEEIVTRMSEGLYQVLKTNKLLKGVK